MRQIVANMHDAKTWLSQLVERAERGDAVFIARNGERAVRLVAVAPRRRPPRGAFAGAIQLPADFNAPPEEIESDFSGK